jgi:hypothetical protein
MRVTTTGPLIHELRLGEDALKASSPYSAGFPTHPQSSELAQHITQLSQKLLPSPAWQTGLASMNAYIEAKPTTIASLAKVVHFISHLLSII